MNRFDHLPALNGQPARAVPKPDRLAEKVRADRALALQDLRWQRGVKDRDGWICQICGRKVHATIAFVADRAEADHLFPKSTYPELRHELDNGVTECLECHRRAQHDRSLIPDLIRARAELCWRRIGLGEGDPQRAL